jgi:hypothetical protein
MKSIGSKASAVAKAIQQVAETSSTEENVFFPSLLAALCLACEHIRMTPSSAHVK